MAIEVKQLKDALLAKKNSTTSSRLVATSSNYNTVLTIRGTVVLAPPCYDKRKQFSEFFRAANMKSGTSLHETKIETFDRSQEAAEIKD